MTRPRPSFSPALAGAVDLSAFKQSATAQKEAAGGGAGGSAGVDISEANFETEVLDRSNQVPVVVVLWSPRSEVSAQLRSTLAGLSDSAAGKWALTTVNVDTTPRIAQMFGVQAIPTVVAIAAGQPISSFQGPQPPEQLRRWVDSLVAATAGKLSGAADSAEHEQADPELVRARDLLDSGDFEGSLNAYQAILDKDPSHPEAKAAIRQITFLQRATQQRPDATQVADASPDDIDAALAAADVDILSQQVEMAFERLIALVRRTGGDERTKVRTRLIELFDLFDPADPAVITGRRNLANALY